MAFEQINPTKWNSNLSVADWLRANQGYWKDDIGETAIWFIREVPAVVDSKLAWFECGWIYDKLSGANIKDVRRLDELDAWDETTDFRERPTAWTKYGEAIPVPKTSLMAWIENV